jgi:hypothetical protein
MAYQKINTTPQGPAQLDGSEYGDSWDGAMKKADAMFAELYAEIDSLKGQLAMYEAPKS